jgi:transcriptional regulator with XRE-family HTH domain
MRPGDDERKKLNHPSSSTTRLEGKRVEPTSVPDSSQSKDSGDDRRAELRFFLRAKRASIRPGMVGLPSVGPRRVKGLRREELASIAGVGLTWYTWLEQGREIQASRAMLHRLANALGLSSSDTAYLFSLAGEQAPAIRELPPALDVTIQEILDGYTAGLAYMFDDVFDVQAFNESARFVYRFDQQTKAWPRNMAWRNFTDPYRRTLYSPWLEYAEMMVGIFRARWAQCKDNPVLGSLLNDLLAASPDFNRLWNASKETGPSDYFPISICLDVPQIGVLKLTSVRLTIATHPDWFVMFQNPVDAATADAIKKIRSRSS